MAYKIINMWLPESKYSIKAPYAMNAESITIHNTGNTASAREEATYHNSNNNQVSFHVVIDETEVVQVIPFNRNAFASGDGIGLTSGNRTSIHIEIARSMDNGYSGPKSQRYMEAEDNAVEYVAHVMHEKKWGMSRLVRHFDWSGKDCPHKMHATGTYQQFRNKVEKRLNELNGEKVEVVKPNVQKAPSKAINIDTNKYRKRSEKAYFKGTIDSFDAEVRKRTGSQKTGFNFTTKAGYSLKSNETVYIFETHNGWGRIYTGAKSGKGSNDWIWLERMKVTEVFK